MKKYILPVILALIVGLAFFFRGADFFSRPPKDLSEKFSFTESPIYATYILDGKKVELFSGYYEELNEQGGTLASVGIFGEKIIADLDADGDLDNCFLLLFDREGERPRFYLIASVQVKERWSHEFEATFVGEDILPDSINFEKGVISFTYLERRAGELPEVLPSVQKTTRFKVREGELVRI